MISQRVCAALCGIVLLGSVSAADQPQTGNGAPGAAVNVELVCTTDPREPRAWYVGPYKGFDNNLSGVELARDMYCADLFKKTRYPNGFVTIFGSSRITEYFEDPTLTKNACTSMSLSRESNNTYAETSMPLSREFNKTYAEVRTFANMWTRRYGASYPILTGAGPGLMEAGSIGASEAGKSIGYTTYYAPPNPGDAHGYSDDPRFWRFVDADTKAAKEITGDGLVFSSVSARETAMILHSAAIVISPGGSGTEWETFQILEMIKSKQLRPVPIFFIGERYHWTSLTARLRDMEDRGTIKKGSLSVEFSGCPADLTNKLAFRLGLSTDRPVDEAVACAKRSDYEIKALRQFGITL